MSTFETQARLNADDELIINVTFCFDPYEPFIISMVVPDDVNDVEYVWDIGRSEIRDAIYTHWPSGMHEIIMIKFENTLRMYLKGEGGKTASLDFDMKELSGFLIDTYFQVSAAREDEIIKEEIERWTST